MIVNINTLKYFKFLLNFKGIGTISVMQFGLTLAMTKKVKLNKSGWRFCIEFIIWYKFIKLVFFANFQMIKVFVLF